MGVLSLSGALTGGPPQGSEGFPGSSINAPVSFVNNVAKSYNVATGVLTRNVQSPSAFVTLDGVGATATVTKGDTLWFRCNGPLVLRLTIDDGAGGSTVSTIDSLQGLVLLEFASPKNLKLLEVKGSAQLEYFVSGPQ